MNRIYQYGIYLAFAGVLVYTAYSAQAIDVNPEYFFLFSLITVFVLLPLIDGIIAGIRRLSASSITPDAFVDTIDTIIQLNSIDELLSTQFTKILHLLGLRKGTMIFHNKETGEYIIYLKKVEPDTFIRTGTISPDNILFKMMNSPDDIIIKSNIGTHLSMERDLSYMMEQLQAEIIIPMYYSGLFTGAMIFEKRHTKYSTEEIDALKIFASKIASLSINSMLWKDLARKIELEKERKMELRVQRSFLPEEKLHTGSCQVSVYFNMNVVLFDRFHTLFSHNETTYFISYRTAPENRSTLIFLPSLAILVETYIRLDMPLSEAVAQSKADLLKKNMFDDPPDIFACSISPLGKLDFTNETRIEPFLFRDGALLYPAIPGPMKNNDIFIYTNTHIKRVFTEYCIEIGNILSADSRASADEMKKSVIAFLNSRKIIKEKSFFSLFVFRKGR